MRKTVKMMVVAALCGLSGLTFAALPGSYAGLGIGASRIDSPNADLVSGLDNISQKRTLGGVGYRIFSGYNFNRFLGIEVGAAKYAQSKYSASSGPESLTLTYNSKAIDLVGKVYLPISDTGFNLYGLGGIARVNASQKIRLSNGDISAEYSQSTTFRTTKNRPVYGGGISYDASSKVVTSLEFSRIQGTGQNSTMPNNDMLTLNIAYNFG